MAIWNSLAGVTPVKKFKTAKTAVAKIWERIHKLAEPAQPAKSKAQRKATGRAQGAGVAPAKGKATKKPTPAKKAD